MTNEEMAKAAQTGSRAALTELWGAVRPLLLSMAWRFYTRQGKERCASHGLTLEDLQQEAFFALWDAVKAYKPEKGYQLTTYLSRATENRFRACMGIRGKADALNHADRLERPIPGEEEGRQQGDTIPDEQAQAALEAVDDSAQQEQLQAILGETLEALPAPQGDVLRLRFLGQRTRQQTAHALGLTLADVRREEQRALAQLRRRPAVRLLGAGFLEGAAYRGTGWHAWYFEQGSVEERLAERGRPGRGDFFGQFPPKGEALSPLGAAPCWAEIDENRR